MLNYLVTAAKHRQILVMRRAVLELQYRHLAKHAGLVSTEEELTSQISHYAAYYYLPLRYTSSTVLRLW